MNSWSIGNALTKCLVIEVLSPPADDCGYDWISARATVDVGGFHGDTQLMITLTDMIRFRNQLQTLYRTLNGDAEFTTVENQIGMKLTADRLGHINVIGHLMDNAGIGNKLTFSLEFDQTFLRKTIDDLEKTIAAAEKSRGEPGISGYGAGRAAPKR